eukprot:321647-Amorphochlora_amoeboformis.AAC.1
MLVHDSFPRFVKSKHYQRFIRAILKRQDEKIWVSLASFNTASKNAKSGAGFEPMSVTRTPAQAHYNTQVSATDLPELKVVIDADIKPTATANDPATDLTADPDAKSPTVRDNHPENVVTQTDDAINQTNNVINQSDVVVVNTNNRLRRRMDHLEESTGNLLTCESGSTIEICE